MLHIIKRTRLYVYQDESSEEAVDQSSESEEEQCNQPSQSSLDPEQLPEGQFHVERLVARRMKVLAIAVTVRFMHAWIVVAMPFTGYMAHCRWLFFIILIWDRS